MSNHVTEIRLFQYNGDRTLMTTEHESEQVDAITVNHECFVQSMQRSAHVGGGGNCGYVITLNHFRFSETSSNLSLFYCQIR